MTELYNFLGLTISAWVVFGITLIVDRWHAAEPEQATDRTDRPRRLAA